MSPRSTDLPCRSAYSRSLASSITPSDRLVRHTYRRERHAGAYPERVRDLGDPVDVLDQLAQPRLVRVAGGLAFVLNRLGHRWIPGEVAAHGHAHLVERDAEPGRLAVEVVRHAAGDRQIQELAAVEADAIAASICRAIDD